MTKFNLLRNLCGLSIREAATFLNARRDTAKSWASGRNPTPAGALRELQQLAERIRRAAEQALDMLDTTLPPSVTLGYCSDDHEAKSLGFPTVSAHNMVLARILAEAPAGVEVQLVARGSETLSAAAAEAHDK